MVFLNHKKKYDNFCENSHFFEIHGQNWGVRGGRNWFKKTKSLLFFETSSMCPIPYQVSLAYHYYLKSYGMWMLKLLKRHHLFFFFPTTFFFFLAYFKALEKKCATFFTHFLIFFLRLEICGKMTQLFLQSFCTKK